MFKKTAIAALALVAGLSFAMPAAAAETFTTADGVLSIDLPGEEWKEIEDPSKWVTLSDGACLITIEHYANGEDLPGIAVANDQYVNVYQGSFSTQNEVFIITGYVTDAEDIPEIANAIISAKVLKYDTKLAVKKEKETSSTPTSEYTVASVNKTMYVTADYLYVRESWSTDSKVIGGYDRGASVKVTGSVQKNGADIGWCQVAYGAQTGYVSGEFLTDKAPASDSQNNNNTDKKSSDTSYTGNVKTVYDETGEAYTLYESTDGYWYDRSGTKYSRQSDTDFQVWEGTKRLTTYVPDDDVNSERDFYDTNTVTVYDESGEAYTLYEGSDGLWREEDGTTYSRVSDSEFQVWEGTRRVTTYYPSQSDADSDINYDNVNVEGDPYGNVNEEGDDYDNVNVEGDPYDNPSVTVSDEYGDTFILYLGSDGYWHEDDGTSYTEVGDGQYQVVEGTRRVFAV